MVLNVHSSVEFSSVKDGIYALRKAHMRSTASQSRKFPPTLPFGNGSNVRLIDDGPNVHKNPIRLISDGEKWGKGVWRW